MYSILNSFSFLQNLYQITFIFYKNSMDFIKTPSLKLKIQKVVNAVKN